MPYIRCLSEPLKEVFINALREMEASDEDVAMTEQMPTCGNNKPVEFVNGRNTKEKEEDVKKIQRERAPRKKQPRMLFMGQCMKRCAQQWKTMPESEKEKFANALLGG